MCVSRFNVIMTIMGGQLTRVEEINLLPFHSIRENLKYGRSPVSWDMLYNMVMFVPFGVIYCYYQKNFRVYKAVGMSCLTTFFIESAQLVLKTGVVDIDDLIVNTLGSLTGIVVYVILQQISSNVLQGLTHVNKSVYNRKRICSQLIAYLSTQVSPC